MRFVEASASTASGQTAIYFLGVLGTASFDDGSGYPSDQLLTSGAWGDSDSPSLPLIPNPSSFVAIAPPSTQRIIARTSSDADFSSGYTQIIAPLRIEFFLDLAQSDFWTDFIGTSPG